MAWAVCIPEHVQPSDSRWLAFYFWGMSHRLRYGDRRGPTLSGADVQEAWAAGAAEADRIQAGKVIRVRE